MSNLPSPSSIEDSVFENGCREAVIDLHLFFEQWFNGTIPENPESLDRFRNALADDFEYVGPGGHLLKKSSLFKDGTWPGHGWWRTRGGVRTRVGSLAFRRLSPQVALMTFEYWQDTREESRGRLSTAVLRLDPSRLCGVVFLQVHETWLPDTPQPQAE